MVPLYYAFCFTKKMSGIAFRSNTKNSHHWPRAPAWAQARKTDPQLSFKNLSICSFSAAGNRKIRWQRINSWVKHVGSPEGDNHESIHGLKPIHIQQKFGASIMPKMDQVQLWNVTARNTWNLSGTITAPWNELWGNLVFWNWCCVTVPDHTIPRL